MDFDAWEADLAAGTATHASGFVLKVEGNPRNPSSVDPGKFPADLNFVDQARLLRCGMEFLAKAASDNGATHYSSKSGFAKVDDPRMAAIRAREEEAKRFAERSDKPKRSVLSLKKGS
jgi:hypothetical protein